MSLQIITNHPSNTVKQSLIKTKLLHPNPIQIFLHKSQNATTKWDGDKKMAQAPTLPMNCTTDELHHLHKLTMVVQNPNIFILI